MNLGEFCDTDNNQFYFVHLLFVAPIGYVLEESHENKIPQKEVESEEA